MYMCCSLIYDYTHDIIVIFFFLSIRRPPRSTRTDTLFPTRRSSDLVAGVAGAGGFYHALSLSGGDPVRADGWPPPPGRAAGGRGRRSDRGDRKSTRLNSSH